MAKAGLGVGLDSVSLASEEMKDGTLVPMFPALEGIRFRAYWLVYPSPNLRRRAVELFREWLGVEVDRFEREAAAIRISRLPGSGGDKQLQDVFGLQIRTPSP